MNGVGRRSGVFAVLGAIKFLSPVYIFLILRLQLFCWGEDLSLWG